MKQLNKMRRKLAGEKKNKDEFILARQMCVKFGGKYRKQIINYGYF